MIFFYNKIHKMHLENKNEFSIHADLKWPFTVNAFALQT